MDLTWNNHKLRLMSYDMRYPKQAPHNRHVVPGLCGVVYFPFIRYVQGSYHVHFPF